MGACVGDGNPRDAITVSSLTSQLIRIRLVFEQLQLKLQRELDTQENILIQIFAQEPSRRTRTTEKALIGRTVYNKNLGTIYKYIEMQAKRLLQSKQLFERWETISNLLPSINTLIYCSIFIKEEELDKFYRLIRTKFPEYKFPTDSDIRLDLVRHHRHSDEVSFEMQNTFILQFSSKTNIEVSRINQAGHSYRYGAGTVSYSHQM